MPGERSPAMMERNKVSTTSDSDILHGKRISRRELMQLAASMGAACAWAGPRRFRRCPGRSAATCTPRASRRAIRPSTASSSGPGGRSKRTSGGSADRRSGGGPGVPQRDRARASGGLRRVRLDLPRAGRRPASRPANTGTASSTSEGNGSRIGRTLTAPAPDDPRPSRFAFVSCQNAARAH